MYFLRGLVLSYLSILVKTLHESPQTTTEHKYACNLHKIGRLVHNGEKQNTYWFI